MGDYIGPLLGKPGVQNEKATLHDDSEATDTINITYNESLSV